MKLCKALLAVLILFRFADGVSRAQTAPGSRQAPAASAPHDSCADDERAAIERGEGIGMADPAARGGYPGPRHLLELIAGLKFSPEQVIALRKLQGETTEKAEARGKEMLAAEARLEEMFREGRPEADLREQSFRMDSLHAELRWVHLSAHLAARALLTPAQLAAYQRLLPASPARPAPAP